ncbi:MAG: NADPH-dependent FMN reductase [Halobacteriaceae archaeon]
MPAPTVAGVCGSLRDDSNTRTALRVALDAAATAGGATTLLDLRDYNLPVYDGDAPEAGDATAFRETVREADAVLLATPVYHATLASPLKAALDYCRREDLDGTTVGLLCTTGGPYYGPALAHLRAVSQILNAWVLPHQVSVPDANTTITDDRIRDQAIQDRLERMGEAAVAYATIDDHPQTVAETAVLAGE